MLAWIVGSKVCDSTVSAAMCAVTSAMFVATATM